MPDEPTLKKVRNIPSISREERDPTPKPEPPKPKPKVDWGKLTLDQIREHIRGEDNT